MKKKAILRVIALSCAGIILFLGIYLIFFKINYRNFSESIALGTYDSPDRNHTVYISLKIPGDRSSSHYFVMGTLEENKYKKINNQLFFDGKKKIVYWNKVKGDIPRESLVISWVDMDKFQPADISVKWVDNKNFQIEDKTLNVRHGSYDYRRDFLKDKK